MGIGEFDLIELITLSDPDGTEKTTNRRPPPSPAGLERNLEPPEFHSRAVPQHVIDLKWSLEKQGVEVWTGLKWHMTRISNGLF